MPSLASANQACLKEEMERVASFGRLHFDIEDGNFVDNITFGLKTIRDVTLHTHAVTDAHLMVTNPFSYLNELAKANLKAVAVHIEALHYPMETINKIKDNGMRAGLALNPRTLPEEIYYYRRQVDYILVMTGEPDGRDGIFQPAMLEKIKTLRNFLPKEVSIFADGGITLSHLEDLQRAGADGCVVGRGIFQSGKMEEFQKYSSL